LNQISSFDPSTAPRRPLRPLHGIPDRDKRGAAGFVMSALLHLLVLAMLLLPALLARQLNLPLETGGGGPGAAGGGGGGTGGTGGAEVVRTERLRYLHVAPAAPATAAPVMPPVEKVEKKPEPVVEKPPEPVPEPVVTPAPPSPSTVSAGVAVPVPGMGGGSGNDGTAGNGPGTGGGIGSGIGTGRGSGIGPGTGGGDGDIYPPQVTNLAILPIPVPAKVRPYKLVAYFDVDEKGNAKLISFNPSKDGGYNRKIREMLAEVRFRPAVRQDGTAVRDTAWITAEAPR
jgi:protein TonB